MLEYRAQIALLLFDSHFPAGLFYFLSVSLCAVAHISVKHNLLKKGSDFIIALA